MKTLYLMRHAKAGRGDGALSDFDRPLTSRGANDASLIGLQLKQNEMVPQAIIASAATRTLSTAQIIAPYVANTPIHQSKSLYLASEHTLLKLVNTLQEELTSVMLIGHNPGISTLIEDLSGHHSINLTTGGLIELHFKVENWQEIFPGNGKIKRSLNPG